MNRIHPLCALLVLLAASYARAAEDQPVVALWPNGAPGSESRKSEPEKWTPATQPGGSLHVSNIHNPTLTLYLPAKERATGAAIIVAPGGGHRYLAWDFEGQEVGTWLANNGIAAFILKYRLARDEGGNSPYTVEEHALKDAQRAIRLVRERAKEWGVNPQRIGFMGFSAGGQLAGMVATQFGAPNSNLNDPIERVSDRPDFVVLGYAAFNPPPQLPKNLPPAFIVGAADDAITTRSSPAIFSAFVAAGGKAEIHIFSHGGHGFGMRDRQGSGGPVVQWNQRLKDWLSDLGMLSPAK